MNKGLPLIAVHCAAILIFSGLWSTANASAPSNGVTMNIEGLHVECHAKHQRVKIHIRSQDEAGKLVILSNTGNRLSHTVSQLSAVNLNMGLKQFPLTVHYVVQNDDKETHFLLSSDCTFDHRYK